MSGAGGGETSLSSIQNSFINSEVFLSWARDVFLPEVEERRAWLRRYVPGASMKAVLIMDQCTCHTTPAFNELMRRFRVETCLLVPHTSHLTQPLDLGVFGATKDTIWEGGKYKVRINQVDEALAEEIEAENEGRELPPQRGQLIAEFVLDVLKAYKKATCVEDTVLAAFEQAGICYRLSDRRNTRHGSPTSTRPRRAPSSTRRGSSRTSGGRAAAAVATQNCAGELRHSMARPRAHHRAARGGRARGSAASTVRHRRTTHTQASPKTPAPCAPLRLPPRSPSATLRALTYSERGSRSYEAGSLELRKPGRPAGHNSALLKFSVFFFLAVRRFAPRNVLRLAAPRGKSAVTLRRRKISASYFYFQGGTQVWPLFTGLAALFKINGHEVMKTKIRRYSKTNQLSTKKAKSIFTFVQGESWRKWKSDNFWQKIGHFIFVLGDHGDRYPTGTSRNGTFKK